MKDLWHNNQKLTFASLESQRTGGRDWGWKSIQRHTGWKLKFGEGNKPIDPRSWENLKQDKHKEVHTKNTS